MKISTTKNEITALRFENKELEAEITRQNLEGIDLSVELGKDQAINLQPSLSETSSGHIHYNKIRYHFQQVISHIKSVLQPNLTEATSIDHDSFDRKEKRISASLKTANHNLGLAGRELQKSQDKGDHLFQIKKRRFGFVRLLCVLLVSADFFFSASSLQKIGFNFLAAHIVAAAIAAAIYFAAEMTPVWLEKVGSQKKKRIRAILVFVLFTIVFSFLAYLRTTGQDGETSGTLVRRLSFIILNLFLVGISILLIAHTRLIKSEQQRLDRYLTLKAKQAEVLDEKTKLEAELDEILQERKKLIDAEKALMIYGGDLEQQVTDAYHSAFSQYCAANLYNRSDYKAEVKPPRFFNHPPKPLTLYFPKQTFKKQ